MSRLAPADSLVDLAGVGRIAAAWVGLVQSEGVRDD
jgi:hypothetical protein